VDDSLESLGAIVAVLFVLIVGGCTAIYISGSDNNVDIKDSISSAADIAKEKKPAKLSVP